MRTSPPPGIVDVTDFGIATHDVRLLILMPFVLFADCTGWSALKRKGLGLRATGFLAAVMLVEDLRSGLRATDLRSSFA